MNTEEHIKEIWDMLDNAQAYSDEEIRHLLSEDEDAREAYRLMVEIKNSYRQLHSADKAIDVDRAWERFASEHPEKRNKQQPQFMGRLASLRKYAAIGIAVLLMSGLSYAAIIQMRRKNEIRKKQPVLAEMKSVPARQYEASSETADTLQVKPKTFDNVPLGRMLPEIADYYGMKVKFLSEDVKELRLFFTWNPKESIDKVINKLNQFERLNVKRDGQDIVVE